MELTIQEEAVIYNALCSRRKELENLIEVLGRREETPECEFVLKNIHDQIDTIDELFESGKF